MELKQHEQNVAMKKKPLHFTLITLPKILLWQESEKEERLTEKKRLYHKTKKKLW